MLAREMMHRHGSDTQAAPVVERDTTRESDIGQMRRSLSDVRSDVVDERALQRRLRRSLDLDAGLVVAGRSEGVSTPPTACDARILAEDRLPLPEVPVATLAVPDEQVGEREQDRHLEQRTDRRRERLLRIRAVRRDGDGDGELEVVRRCGEALHSCADQWRFELSRAPVMR